MGASLRCSHCLWDAEGVPASEFHCPECGSELTGRMLDERALDLLRTHEWISAPWTDKLVCPECHMDQDAGHAPDCEWAAVLRNTMRT